MKKKISRSLFAVYVRKNIQNILFLFIECIKKYGKEPFLLYFELKSFDSRWEKCDTIRPSTIPPNSNSPTHTKIKEALEFTKKFDLLSLAAFSDNEDLSSPIFFIDYMKLLNNNTNSMSLFSSVEAFIHKLSEGALSWNNFMEAEVWNEDLFGAKLGLAVSEYNQSTHGDLISSLAKKHNFFPKAISKISKGWKYLGSRKITGGIVGFCKDELVTFCLYREKKKSDGSPSGNLHIDFFFISPSFQNHGLGANLIVSLLESFKVRPKLIEVESKNTDQAENFWYKKLNFKRSSSESNFGCMELSPEIVYEIFDTKNEDEFIFAFNPTNDDTEDKKEEDSK